MMKRASVALRQCVPGCCCGLCTVGWWLFDLQHQQQVAAAVERAKQVTMQELNAIIGVSLDSSSGLHKSSGTVSTRLPAGLINFKIH